MKQKFMVTSALPYANGPIHLGHIAGAYLPGDIFTRFQRMIGNDVVYICGTDEHGVPITLRAEQEGVTPRTIVQRYHENIKSAFQRFNIVFDNFSGTSNVHNKYHAHLSREFFLNLMRNHLIVSRICDQHFCEKCDRFLPDRFIQGICPRCGYAEARGDECSQCNKPFETLELKQPKCKICGNAPTVRPTKHWYLKLDLLQKELEQWLDTKAGFWKENVINFVRGWFKDGLTERAITRDLYWGVPVPLDEEGKGKVLYVWFDAPIGYISSTMEWAERTGNVEKWRDYWQNPDCKIVHFIGKDNIPFHAIIWPGMLLGQRQNYQLPWHVPANEYLTFGITGEEVGEKASKSKGNVVWVHDAVDMFGTDMLRYYLAANAPEKNDSMFTWRDFQKKCNGELLAVLGNFFNRILKFIEKNFESQLPPPDTLSTRDQEILNAVTATVAKVRDLFDHFEVRAAVAEIVALARLGNQYFDEKAPWKSLKENKSDCQTCMYVGVKMVQAIAVMLTPVIPGTMERLWQQLGYTGPINTWDLATQEITAGHKIVHPEGLFRPLEDEVIQRLEAKLLEAVANKSKENTPPATSTTPATPAPTTSTTPSPCAAAPAAPAAASVAPAATPVAPAAASVAPAATPATPAAPAGHAEVKPAAEVSLEEFQRIEIKIAEVVAAERVPKAKKLLQLKVKIGEEVRTVISGIAESYTPEQMVGRKVPLLMNLKPAVIRGITSQGMILCADIGGKPILLQPEQDAPSGSIVR